MSVPRIYFPEEQQLLDAKAQRVFSEVVIRLSLVTAETVYFPIECRGDSVELLEGPAGSAAAFLQRELSRWILNDTQIAIRHVLGVLATDNNELRLTLSWQRWYDGGNVYPAISVAYSRRLSFEVSHRLLKGST